MPRKVKVGKVVSNKMDKTIVVELNEKHSHPKYGKIMTKSIKFKAHDEANVCNMGDIVRIVESRPISRDKRWMLAEVVQKAEII